MPALDLRLLQVTIELDGQARTYSDLAIRAVGKKFASALQNECQISVANLDKPTRDYLLTVGTPFSRLSDLPRNAIRVEAGRESIGLSTLYEGGITTVIETQPPDIWMVIGALTARYEQGIVISTSEPPETTLRSITLALADRLDVSLEYNAPSTTLINYHYTGSVTRQIQSLNKLIPTIIVYLDDGVLVVQATDSPRGIKTFFITSTNGLIGKPNFDPFGVRCTVLYRPDIVVGSQIVLDVDEYPAANGAYTLYEVGFDLANRELPFYQHLRGRRALQ